MLASPPFAPRALPPDVPPIIFFDGYANTSPVISQDVPRRAAHLIVEAFPTSPGTATVQVVDANAQAGPLTNTTDSNGLRKSISAYTKFLCKGVMERVAIQLTVQSGAWSVWGTFTDQGSDRANYYDRNPTAIIKSAFLRTTAPHSSTQRWIYTVPANRKAFVEYLTNKLRRASAASAVADFQSVLQYTPSGGGANIVSEIISQDNTLENAFGDVVGSFGLLVAGDSMNLLTSDLSTGGTVDYFSALKATEFDT